MKTHNNLSNSAQRVQDALQEYKLSLEIIELASSARSAQEASKALGCELGQIVKSLVFKTLEGECVLILASGINRVDEKIIEAELGQKIIKADGNYTREITGFAIGGVPPIGHKQLIKHIFIDKDLLLFNTLWAAAGTPHAVFKLSPDDLKILTLGTVVSIT